MKKLLNTLYITGTDKYLSLDGENIVVQCNQAEIARYPLHNFEGIVTFGYAGASPALMGACASRGISLSFLSQSGRFLAGVHGETRGNVTLRREQYRLSEDESKCTRIAANFISGKLYNSKWVLERAARDYPMRLDADLIKSKSAFMSDSMKAARGAKDTAQLRGIEGEAASMYFSVFDNLILQQKEDFFFTVRSRRPPLDNVNALLSFSYTLLSRMCVSALETVGLDPYVGFMHKERPGRTSLALDLMEELRPVLADRFVLTLINKRIIDAGGFEKKENGAIMMKDDARKAVLTSWQQRKQDEIKHPFLDEKLAWGMIPYVQAMLLARYIRGDMDEYPPFMWK